MTEQKREYWSNLIAEQKGSGQTIRAFCREQSVGDHSIYYWRNRLENSAPVQFALLRTVASAVPLELILANGEQLRIRNGVNADRQKIEPWHITRAARSADFWQMQLIA